MYVIFYTIVYEKGYQRRDDVIGAVSTKTKGSGSIDTNSHIQGTFDSIDLIYPSIETNSLFIATAITNTPNQIQSDCIGNSDSDSCVNDSDCNEGEYNEWGRYNGICGINGYCQIYGWCPIENDTIKYRIENVGNFTVFIKVEGRFDEFKITRSNTDDRYGTGKPTWDYNLFTIDSLVGMSTNGLTVDDVADRGAILLANVNWDCDFDSKKGLKDCYPRFEWKRIDSEPDSISRGFNFRTAQYYYTNNRSNDDISSILLHRDLRKLYGIRIIFIISGYGGKFDITALSLTLGAGIAYIGIATVISDLLLQYFVKEKDLYEEAKFKFIGESPDKQSIGKSPSFTHSNNADINDQELVGLM